MSRVLLIALVAVAILVAGWVLQLLWAAGQFKTLEPHFEGTCAQIEGLAGAEDLTIHPRTGVAYLSAYDRRAAADGEPARGAIYAYDLKASAPKLVDLTPDAPPGFRPHGLSLYAAPNRRDALFVINHAGGQHTVEVYDLVRGRLAHRETLADPLLVSPNDLVAVGPRSFYASNDHGNPEGFGRTLEEYLRLPLANVVYYDGERFHEAADGVRMANGINASSDGRTLYVAATIGRSVRVYDRDPASGDLALREEIPIGSGVDNIEVDADGALWIGSHPKLLDVVAHSSDASRRAPSQVLRVAERTDGGWAVDEIYLDLGDELSAASAAAVRGERLLVGAIYDARFLDCRMQ
jgi:arylesterase/paraoxonase